MPRISPGVCARRIVVAAAGACFALAGCSATTSAPDLTPTAAPTVSVLPIITARPQINRLLSLPVATPSVCVSQNGTTTGRLSPWADTVDVSVFTKPGDSHQQISAIGKFLHKQGLVSRIYFESQREAYQEFQRLYTCSAHLHVTDLPASWRLVLRPGTTVTARNGLVAAAQRLPGVQIVSCSPSIPCVDVVRSVEPSVTAASTPSPSTSH